MRHAYIHSAMSHATHQSLEESGRYFFEIPGLHGVWATSDTLEPGRAELQEVLEDWIELGLSMRHHIPIVDGIDINLDGAADLAD